MKIYTISGLGADGRLFDKLKLDYPRVHLDWPDISSCDSLEEYADAFLSKINTSEDFILLGASMGGMMCSEIAQKCNPKLVILLSSAEKRSELPALYRMAGNTKLLSIIPERILSVPDALVIKLFGSRADIFQEYVRNIDKSFALKAAQLITKWQKTDAISQPKLKIKGDKDYILPYRCADTITIKDGGHSIVYDNAEEVSEIINKRLKTI